jgi:dolichol-phosphate mannosyltransferase
VIGALSFCAVCAVGAAANVRVAAEVFDHQYSWWLSGLAGAATSVVWNYVITSMTTWRRA